MRRKPSEKKRRSTKAADYPNIIEEPIRVMPEPKGSVYNAKPKQRSSTRSRQKKRS